MRQQYLWLRSSGAAMGIILAVAFSGSAGAVNAATPPGGQRPGPTSSPKEGNVAAPVPGTAHTLAAVQAAALSEAKPLLAQLSPAQLAGQRVIFSYSGVSPPASLLSLIRKGQAGGVIFFGKNITSRAQITGAIKQLIAANNSTSNPARAYPLLLMTDQEGGEVRRLPGAPRLSEKQIGQITPLSAAVAAATSAGKNAAANLLSTGMNVNLAPVLDVYRQPGDFDDQFQRSYSMRPTVVSALGAAFITAQQAGKVAATAKHFPGLGAATASQDTDMVPVTLNVSRGTLVARDMYPYKAAISAGVKLVMVSWAVYPAFDPSRPAGLSQTIVQDRLRKQLNFTGVTITDAIGAGALRAYGTTANKSLLAAEAGMDLILSAAMTVTEGTQCASGLLTGYNNGKLNHATFQAAVAQILALRKTLPP
ncbi:MAG: glycoside hydrolase family 3 N-terminal domain-containing protein [Streptosporangiaceae bacterium]